MQKGKTKAEKPIAEEAGRQEFLLGGLLHRIDLRYLLWAQHDGSFILQLDSRIIGSEAVTKQLRPVAHLGKLYEVVATAIADKLTNQVLDLYTPAKA